MAKVIFAISLVNNDIKIIVNYYFGNIKHLLNFLQSLTFEQWIALKFKSKSARNKCKKW